MGRVRLLNLEFVIEQYAAALRPLGLEVENQFAKNVSFALAQCHF